MDGSKIIDRLEENPDGFVVEQFRWQFLPDYAWATALYFPTKREAVAAQHGWRIARGYNPVTGKLMLTSPANRGQS